MHLRSITLKGFKSFPQRTKLEFAPGVSVIVGPNGSGKSNVTDAVLWALGEQSPLAVRGHTMKDVIFAGAHGMPGAGAAEVEVVIDNADGALQSDFAEISIVRRLRRDGDGEYRLNGAKCRLVDVLEVLSDSGLGKEMHSVVSQGKVEEIVLSQPRERRLLLEEAAGLGKHRKRRRRAQRGLERTEENLSRALDVEREARSRLRPLRRQAEAAELHARLERQSLEARLELSRDAVRAARRERAAAESKARAARVEQERAERLLAAVAERREAAEEAFAAHSRAREELQRELFAARSAADRIAMQLERAREQARAAGERGERRRRQLEVLSEQLASDEARTGSDDGIARLETELAELDTDREDRLRVQLADLEAQRREAERHRERAQRAAEHRRDALRRAEREAEAARRDHTRAERAGQAARARTARAGAELASVNEFLRSASTAPAGARSLADGLRADEGYELALAAALGPRLRAAVVDDLGAGEAVLEEAGQAGGTAILRSSLRGRPAGRAPTEGARRLIAHVRAEPPLGDLAERLLGEVWVVESLDAVSRDFRGVAVTRGGRMLDATHGELAQVGRGGAERVIEERGRRDRLVLQAAEAARDEADARAAVERAGERMTAADAARDEAEVALRRALREVDQAAEAAERAGWLIARRREAPDEGPEAVRRAELQAELRAERRMVERTERERRERTRLADALATGVEHDRALVASAERASSALESALGAVATRGDGLASELDSGAAASAQTAATLRACAHEEAELQGRLRTASEAVTAAEVAAQQVRDHAAEAERELGEIAGRLGVAPEPAVEALADDERVELRTRVERLARRREQLGPVNPLARREYQEAVAHVEELEAQRADLEAALAELEELIRETDRRIRASFEETFEAAARNFEEVVQHLFPGGRGRLRLVRAEGPRPVIGGEEPSDAAHPDAVGQEALEPGVEVEVTPAGKATRRLSLLSGGEKSLVALAFMFAVFLARPCPFYILDEVEAALDDVNIDRFLELLRRYSERAQFIVVTHQKRTMDVADALYGVSMGGDGVSRVVSRRLSNATAETSAPRQVA